MGNGVLVPSQSLYGRAIKSVCSAKRHNIKLPRFIDSEPERPVEIQMFINSAPKRIGKMPERADLFQNRTDRSPNPPG